MKLQPDIIGRKKEQEKLQKAVESKKSEFLALYGRRRVGKTFLIRQYFNQRFTFHITGLANADTHQQLFNFDTEIGRQSPLVFEIPSKNWLIAFQRLIQYLETVSQQKKKIIFIDELPWFDTNSSDFMMGLEHFWNSWASNRKDILLIVCGSAASWMTNELLNNTGGLHNRVTQKMKISPFNLQETEEMLLSKNGAFDRYQIVQLYMALGGIPYYLEAVQPNLSATQNIQELFFETGSLLRNEFFNLYRSLYRKHEVYEKIVEVLSNKTEGMQRSEIIKRSGVASGGTLTKVITDLEESGFISSYNSLDGKLKKVTYRLSDYYTCFYFKFIKNNEWGGANTWLNMIDNPTYRTWQGFTFEQICLDHILPIKKALGISGIQSQQHSWRGGIEDKYAQIDLLIDRRDQVINLCECKFSLDTFMIDKAYSENLRSKIATFRSATKTKKAVYLTMITSYGVDKNKYANQLVQNEITMDDLFQ
jgi:AAA+ ATPase superfamily predicted ATPase